MNVRIHSFIELGRKWKNIHAHVITDGNQSPLPSALISPLIQKSEEVLQAMRFRAVQAV